MPRALQADSAVRVLALAFGSSFKAWTILHVLFYRRVFSFSVLPHLVLLWIRLVGCISACWCHVYFINVCSWRSWMNGSWKDVDWKDDLTFATCSTDKAIHTCVVGEDFPRQTFTGMLDIGVDDDVGRCKHWNIQMNTSDIYNWNCKFIFSLSLSLCMVYCPVPQGIYR